MLDYVEALFDSNYPDGDTPTNHIHGLTPLQLRKG